jgi:hypothetical protein
MATERAITTSPPTAVKSKTPDGEIERLQAIVEALRVEIGLCPNLLSTSVTNLNHL